MCHWSGVLPVLFRVPSTFFTCRFVVEFALSVSSLTLKPHLGISETFLSHRRNSNSLNFLTWGAEAKCRSATLCLSCMLPLIAVEEHWVGWDTRAPVLCSQRPPFSKLVMHISKTNWIAFLLYFVLEGCLRSYSSNT